MINRCVIIGAGDAGKLLARSVLEERIEIGLVGFVDDFELIGKDIVSGLKVLGKINDLPRIISLHNVDSVVIAIPSERGKFVRMILLLLQDISNLKIYVLPRVSEIVFGSHVSFNDLRLIDFTDIVGEMIVKADQEKLVDSFSGKNVLVTGGGGSIGSELAKQIFLLRPKKLIVIDFCEKNLFTVESKLSELAEINQHTETEFILGNVNNLFLLERIFSENQIDSVFHAAAYKHVPIVENNVYEGAINNVQATYNLADLSGTHGVKKFVLISTDKAVRPINVMGCSKKIAEKIVFYFTTKYPDTTYSAVRFGNVFNSSGSAAEVFINQLKRGNTITITDPAMSRYFMTIPEAVHLILQSWFITEKGKIFMLEMGDYINITELVKCIAVISGRKLSDLKFKNIGIRDGEKITEDLFDAENEIKRTTIHSRIYGVAPRNELEDDFLERLHIFFKSLEKDYVANHSSQGVVELTNLIKQLS